MSTLDLSCMLLAVGVATIWCAIRIGLARGICTPVSANWKPPGQEERTLDAACPQCSASKPGFYRYTLGAAILYRYQQDNSVAGWFKKADVWYGGSWQPVCDSECYMKDCEHFIAEAEARRLFPKAFAVHEN